MLGACCAYPSADALFNAISLTWSATGAPNSSQYEQGYTLLPDGRVLTINARDGSCFPNCNANAAQAYSPGSGTWSAVASPPISLVDPYQCGTYEIGPAILRPDGTVVAFGGNTGCPAAGSPPDPTAIYNSANNTWIQGPNVPAIKGVNYSLADAPAALLPNGNILFAASPGFFQTGTHFFEFTSDNTINQVADPVYNSSVSSNYFYNFLVLPTGQILATDFSSKVEIYTPTGGPNPGWAPAITSVSSTLTVGQSYSLSGTQLNGLSQGTNYGDDVQAATNYPLVRITNNATGHVFYSRTYNHSTMSVAPNIASSTNFVLPSNMEVGPSQLVVVANGIPSQPVAVTVEYSPLPLLITPSSDVVASGSYGGPFTPSSFQYQLSTPSGTVNYSISGIPDWLTASSTTGTASPSPTIVTFTTNSTANSLSPGTYSSTITFTNTTTNKIVLVITAKLTVSPLATTTALVSAPNPSTLGQTVTFTATVSAASGTPTGTVTFNDNAVALGTGTLSAGVATFVTSALSVGTHSITAVYSGDTNFAASTSSSHSQSVIQRATATALNSSANPSELSQPITFTATVSAASGTPTGTVTFKDNAVVLGTGTLSTGVATFVTSALSVGTHSITAVYGGDTNFAASISSSLPQSVIQHATATALNSSANPSAFDQPVTFTATVSAASGTPTGTVTFKDNAVVLGTGTLSAGVATFVTSALSVGTHTITAIYSGDTNFAGSVSSNLTQTVNQGTTNAALSSSLNPSIRSQSVTFTATVTSGFGTPIGSIAFKDGATTLLNTTLSNGTATYSTSSLVVGDHTITAVYGGSTNFAASTSAALTQTVNNNTTTTALTSSLNPSIHSQSVTFTATVSALVGTPIGSIAFKDGATTLLNTTLSNGTATYSTSSLVVGDHTITAVYGGSTNFAASTSAALTQTVNNNTTTTALTSSLNPSIHSQSVTFTATVSALVGTPIGSIAFKDGATTLLNTTLSNGAATYSTSSLAVGSHTITAVYGGSTNFAASTSAGLIQSVNNNSTALSSSLNPSTFGQLITFTATVSASTGTPTGAVTFKDGTTTLGVGTLSGGMATYVTSSLSIGGHSITAAYSGDTNFTTSISPPLTQVVEGSASTFVSAGTGNDSDLCPVIAPCATLNYALSVTNAGGSVTILDAGAFGPIVLNQPISIIGPKADAAEIVADPTALVGCIGALPSGCTLTNNGYAVEINAGPNDIDKLSYILLSAGPNGGVGALKFTSGGQIQLSNNVYRGNDTTTGPIVALYPSNPGTTQAQVYFSHSDIGFNSNGGAIEVMPRGNTSLKLHFNHDEVHNAGYGIRTDGSLLAGPSSVVSTVVSEAEFFSFANAAVNAFSTAGTGTTNATFDAVKILNANVAIKANGPLSTVVLTNSAVSGNGIGVQVQNGAHVYTPQSNTISGNSTDLSGSLSSAPPR